MRVLFEGQQTTDDSTSSMVLPTYKSLQRLFMAISDSPDPSTSPIDAYLGADVTTEGDGIHLTSSNTGLGVKTSNVDLANHPNPARRLP